jgi:hypothetical protein
VSLPPVEEVGTVFGVPFIGLLLLGVFALAVLAIIVGLSFAVTRRLRDHRTREERWADEHGDMPPGSFKITPGMGSNGGGSGMGTAGGV